MIPVMPVANYTTDKRNTIFVASIAQSFVACKGANCVPALYNKPGKDFVFDSNGIIRYGLDSDTIIEMKVWRFASSIDVSMYNPAYVLLEYTDWDDKKHVLYGIGVSDIPLVGKAIIVTKDGKVFKGEAYLAPEDFEYIGTVDEVVIGLVPQGVPGSPVYMVKPKLPIAIIALVAATALAGYAIHEYRLYKEKEVITNKMMEHIDMVYNDAKNGVIDKEFAIQYLESWFAGNAITYQVKDSTNIDAFVGWMKSHWKELLGGMAALMGVIILVMKWQVINEVLRSIISSFRRR